MFPSNYYLKCYSNFVLNGFSNIIIYYFQILNNRFKNLIFFTIILDYSYSRLIDLKYVVFSRKCGKDYTKVILPVF